MRDCGSTPGCNITAITKGEKGDKGDTGDIGYKSYVAIITQTGTSAPTATILKNTLGTVTYGYDTAGMYLIQSAGLFTNNKTAFFIQTDVDNNFSADGQPVVSMFYSDATEIYLNTWYLKETAGVIAKTFSDGIIGYTTNSTIIEIKVYP